MSDTWNSLTLGSIFPGPSGTINGLKGQADTQFLRYNGILSELANKVAALNSMANESTSLADALTEAGFFRLNLAPGAGGWATRAQAAIGAPPDDGFSAGILIIVQSPDLAGLGDKYTKLTSILNTPVPLG